MVRKFLILLICSVLPAQAITVSVDGAQLPDQPAPILSNGRVLLPMRAVFQALGAKVDYQAGKISAHRADRQVELELGNPTARVQRQPVSLEVAPQLVGGHTYVPLRFVGEALGAAVTWESSSKSVFVQSSGGGSGVVTGAAVSLSPNLAAVIQRLVVGNQGGVLKVLSPSQEVALYRGLDDRNTAPFKPGERGQILATLGLGSSTLASEVIGNYEQLPKRQALALLGVLNTGDDRVRQFLTRQMRHDGQVANRRQATLALAVGEVVDSATVSAVLDFYEGSENLWETFPVQQFFEYHAGSIRALPDYGQVRSRVSQVNSLYRTNILGYLGEL